MSEASPEQRTLDEELLLSFSRWAVVITLSIALMDLAILWNYPFPGSSTVARGVFYVIAGVALIVASIACAFLGYRLLTVGAVRRTKRIYLVFMPLVAIVSSVLWLYLISPAG